jgi:Transposase
MHYCGLDVATKSTHVYIENEQGRRVKRLVVPTTPAGLSQALEPYAERGLRVAVEAGNQTAWICDVLRELTIKVHVVHPLKVKWIAESKKKTDRVDAQLLAQLLRIGGLPEPVHIPSRRSRELRSLLLARRQLVQMRTKLINIVRGLLRQQQVTLKTRALTRARGWAELRGVSVSPAVRQVVDQYEALVTATTTALAGLDGQLAARATRDGRVRRLETIPGVAGERADLGGRGRHHRAVPHGQEAGGLQRPGPQCPSERRARGVRPAHQAGTQRDPGGLGPGGPCGDAGQGPRGGAAAALVRADRPSAGEEDGGGRTGPQAADDRLSGVARRHDVRRPAATLAGGELALSR